MSLEMNCTLYIQLQDSPSLTMRMVTVAQGHLDFVDLWRKQNHCSVSQAVDVSADLQGRTELDVHGGHEMLLLQQEQGLSIDFL